MTDQKLNIIIDIQKKNATAISSLSKDLKGLSKTSGTSTSTIAKGFLSAQAVIGAFQGAMNLASTAVQTFNQISRDTTNALANQQKAFISLEIIAEKRLGKQAIPEVTQAVKDLAAEFKTTDSSMAELMQRMLKSDLTLAQSKDMIKRLANEALTGKDNALSLSDAMEQLGAGYQMDISALLDRAGISENISVILEKEAQARGVEIKKLDELSEKQKLVNTLTDEEIEKGGGRQRLLETNANSLLKYLGFVTLTNETWGSSERFQDSYIMKQAEMERQQGLLNIKLGEIFMPLEEAKIELKQMGIEMFETSGVIDIFSEAIAGGVDWLNKNINYMRDNEIFASELQVAFAGLKDALATFGETLGVVNDDGSINNEVIGDMITNGINLAEAIVRAADAMTKLGEQVMKYNPVLATFNTLYNAIAGAPDINKNVNVTTKSTTQISADHISKSSGGNNVVTYTPAFSKGGIVEPLYANNGALVNFQARGTDTVPAMLTPGEMVVDKQTTGMLGNVLSRLGNILGIPVQMKTPKIDVGASVSEFEQLIKGLEDDEKRAAIEVHELKLSNIQDEVQKEIEQMKFRAGQDIAEFKGNEKQKSEYKKQLEIQLQKEISELVKEQNQRVLDSYKDRMNQMKDSFAGAFSKMQDTIAKNLDIMKRGATTLEDLRAELIGDDTQRSIEKARISARRDIEGFEGTKEQKAEYENLRNQLLQREIQEMQKNATSEANDTKTHITTFFDINKDIKTTLSEIEKEIGATQKTNEILEKQPEDLSKKLDTTLGTKLEEINETIKGEAEKTAITEDTMNARPGEAGYGAKSPNGTWLTRFKAGDPHPTDKNRIWTGLGWTMLQRKEDEAPPSYSQAFHDQRKKEKQGISVNVNVGTVNSNADLSGIGTMLAMATRNTLLGIN